MNIVMMNSMRKHEKKDGVKVDRRRRVTSRKIRSSTLLIEWPSSISDARADRRAYAVIGGVCLPVVPCLVFLVLGLVVSLRWVVWSTMILGIVRPQICRSYRLMGYCNATRRWGTLLVPVLFRIGMTRPVWYGLVSSGNVLADG